MTDRELHASEILRRLAAPFRAEQISWKPQNLYPRENPTRALAVAYVDARDVAERLDEVLGFNWEFSWEPVGEVHVHGKLTLIIDNQRITREDVGEIGEGDQAGLKAAVSDALKRCAVLFGVGRYLYRLPRVWVGYDAQKKQMTETPQLPDWALSRDVPEQATTPEPAPAPVATPMAPAAQPAPAPTRVQLATIKTSQWREMLETLRQSEAGAHYLSKDGSRINAYHVTATAAKLGFCEVTDANISEVYDALVAYGLERLDEKRAEKR